MDKQTIETYDREAEQIAQLHSRLTPSGLYTLITDTLLSLATRLMSVVGLDEIQIGLINTIIQPLVLMPPKGC
jgi:hypothetical protein